MTLSEEISDIEERCAQGGISVAEFLRRANVHPTLWSRYKHGVVNPRRDTWDRVVAEAKSLPALEHRSGDERRSGEDRRADGEAA